MIACLDVHYLSGSGARAACVGFSGWTSSDATWERVVTITSGVEPYVPGQFYKRELPCLLTALAAVPCALTAIVVDGHVYLSPDRAPGLGAHLYDALGGRVPVIGVAKTSFRDAPALEVVRNAARPLYVTAAGMPEAEAAKAITSMHGPYRLPTMLKRADTLCRGLAQPMG